MDGEGTRQVIRVQRGAAGAEELAALVAVLLARTVPAGPTGGGRGIRPVARWRRFDRPAPFGGARTWHL
ncbi:acyl-CoA carboxylase epsilon subunit [Actinoplanes sp. NPDC049681]|uniref:acyl-CoA carboxylase epsilon subunit n=1 Tax=Actinoplanes sp. NPDC049681 TaxID=3363905 RepID=UPI0037B2667B